MPDEPQKKFLIIQTAFLGDVVLATALVEKIHSFFPEAEIHFLLRKGNEELLVGNPIISKVLIWIKKEDKIKNLFNLIISIRKEKYDYVINCHRFFSSGLQTVFSGAKNTIGFKKNPLSFFFTRTTEHKFEGEHETERNQKLIAHLTNPIPSKPRLYPPQNIGNSIPSQQTYITISPASVWFTKQFPKERWVEFINLVPDNLDIVLLGGDNDRSLCEEIKKLVVLPSRVCILAGRMKLLESAALMQNAVMNYMNDSAPMHLASAVDAPTTAIYCSTIPDFGFGPLADDAVVVHERENLPCRPCGIHGYESCPEGHFKCALDINIQELVNRIQ